MRFGKKLALQVLDDDSGAPYMSHKLMKEAINRTVRELRSYQARSQDAAMEVEAILGAQVSAHSLEQLPLQLPEHLRAELGELEARICAFDKELFALVDADLDSLMQHVRLKETRLMQIIAEIQAEALDACLLVDDARRRELEQTLARPLDDPAALAGRLLDLRVECDPCATAEALRELTEKYRVLVEQVNLHAQYLEINVAGFRKLLKRHEKQIPRKFCARTMPFLGFHHLVTHTSRQLLDICRQLGSVLADAWQRLSAHPAALAQLGRGFARAEVPEPKGLGLECNMVLKIQRQLRESMGDALGDASEAPVGHLYPKPSLPDQHEHQPLAQSENRAQRQDQGYPQLNYVQPVPQLNFVHPMPVAAMPADYDPWWVNMLAQGRASS